MACNGYRPSASASASEDLADEQEAELVTLAARDAGDRR